jgi:hypothetical protein
LELSYLATQLATAIMAANPVTAKATDVSIAATAKERVLTPAARASASLAFV